jgi:hypothetical protein
LSRASLEKGEYKMGLFGRIIRGLTTVRDGRILFVVIILSILLGLLLGR